DALVAPGEPRSVIGVPGIALRRLRRHNLNAQLEHGPADPGPVALTPGRERLLLGVEQHSLGDDLAQGRAGRVDLRLVPPHRAAGVEDQLLAEAVAARAVVAEGAEATGRRVDLCLEVLVAHPPLVGEADLARGGRTTAVARGEPREAERRHLDDQP